MVYTLVENTKMIGSVGEIFRRMLKGNSWLKHWCQAVNQIEIQIWFYYWLRCFFRFCILGYNDDGYRPAHIHFNISADGYSRLITQLYFYHDYYLAPRDSCSNCKKSQRDPYVDNFWYHVLLGHSDARSLKVFLTHQHDIKTFEGNWMIVLSKKQRIPFPPLNRKTMKRGSYIEIQRHIMDDHMWHHQSFLSNLISLHQSMSLSWH